MTNTPVENMLALYETVALSLENRITTTSCMSIFDRDYVDNLLIQLWPDTSEDTYTHNVTILYALFDMAKYTYILLPQREELKLLELSYRQLTGDPNFHHAIDTAFYKENVVYEYITINGGAQNKIHFIGLENNLSIRNMSMHKGIQNIVTVLFEENKVKAWSIVQNLFTTNVYSQIFNVTNKNTCSFKNNNETDSYLAWMSENNSSNLISLLFRALEQNQFQIQFENKDAMHVRRMIEVLERNVPELKNVEGLIHLGIELGFELMQIADMIKTSMLQVQSHPTPNIIFDN